MKFLTAMFALVIVACSVNAQCPNGQCQAPTGRYFQNRYYVQMPKCQTCPAGQCATGQCQSCPNGQCVQTFAQKFPTAQYSTTAQPCPNGQCQSNQTSSGLTTGDVVILGGKKFKVTLTPVD